MTNYIDGFILPVPRDKLSTYKEVVEKVAEIWLEHGALDYAEFVSDDTNLEGTLPFSELASAKESEVVIFGWVNFASKKARDLANGRVVADARMADLINPLINTSSPIFAAERMVYGGFRPLVNMSK